MGFGSFVAGRIIRSGKSQPSHTSEKSLTGIAVAAISLGMAVIIIAISVVTGFQNEVSAKVTGFGADITVRGFDTNNSYEETPVETSETMLQQIKSDQRIKNVQTFATKAGIVRSKGEIQGLLLKGVDENYNPDFFKQYLQSGRLPDLKDTSISQDVLISSKTASMLRLKTGDNMVVYFIEQPPRIRKLKICGIYETGLEEFDKLYVICDLRLIRKLNNWNQQQSGGIEVLLHDHSKAAAVADHIYHSTGFKYNTTTIRQDYPQIFNWLDLQNINVIIIITLIIAVAGVSMISTLLIIIMNRATMIGLLKALGARNSTIRNIFIRLSLPIIGKGIFIGNFTGIVLCFLQMKFHIIELSQESYYVSSVPVNLSLTNLLLLNAGAIVACIIILIGPSMIIARMSPARSIRMN